MVSLQSTPNSEYQASALPQIGPLDKSPGAVVVRGPVKFSLSINLGFGLINSGRETCLLAVVNIQCSRLPCCLAAGLFRESSGSGKCVGQHAEISSFQACCTESFFFSSQENCSPLSNIIIFGSGYCVCIRSEELHIWLVALLTCGCLVLLGLWVATSSLFPLRQPLASLNLEQMRSRAHLSPSSSSPSPLALTLPPSWNATPCSCTILPRIVLVIRLCLQPVAKVVEGNAYPST